MCSISGFSWEDKSLAVAMNKVLSYRGPDDNGIYTDNGISIAHNRLSILDLSKAGHQPMTDEEGTLTIVYNGEIYNYMSIRERLEKKGYRFRSNTDTEVIIYAYKEYGSRCLSLFNGMFAFAIWDSEKKEIFMARDRLGIKPLYYHHDGRKLIFSSELKAILKHDVRKDIDVRALNSFFAYRFIIGDRTIFKSVRKLLPGHFAYFKDGKLRITKYWDVSYKISDKPEQWYVKELDRLINESVKRRLISDVPLGCFLSGGVDSSLITAINTKLRGDAVKTYTVGFNHSTDEFRHARTVSDYLGTDHNELTLDYKNITRHLPEIIWHMDEPNSDITMVPLYFLSRFAKKDVTVVNTGEGADELFSGYYHYKIGANNMQIVPDSIKRSVYSWYYSPFKKRHRKNLLKIKDVDDSSLINALRNGPKDILNRILKFDLKNEIPNWQLARVDRMTMAHGMEARVPFLDHKMVEFSTTLPIRYKQPNLDGKYILKKVASNYLPKKIVNRKKQGFTTPMHSWIRDNLEDISEQILLRNKKSFFRYDFIKKLIEKHKKSSGPRAFQLYSFQLLMILFFDIWHDIYVDEVPVKEINKMMRV